MPTVYREVEVDFDVSELDDEDLIEELEQRGYIVTNDEDRLIKSNSTLTKAIDCFKRGDVNEALVYLERTIPELYGLHKYIVKEDHRR
jgi:hypothetical protein